MPQLAATAPTLPPSSSLPQGEWRGSAPAWVLWLSGDWRGHTQALPLPPPELQPAGAAGTLTVDASGLTAWDARLASALWQRLGSLQRGGLEVDLDGLPDGLQQILSLALPPPAAATSAPTATRRALR